MAAYLAGLHPVDFQQPRLSRASTPPSEVWDNDEDFDLSSISGNALELPQSDIDSDNNGRGEDDDTGKLRGAGAFSGTEGAQGEDWDADFAAGEDEDDRTDTLKVSELAAATLAQLALLRKQPSSGKIDAAAEIVHLGSNLPGKVTNLGSYTLKAIPVDAQPGGDWDEDLEVPDAFPRLRLSQNASSFVSDLDSEPPSMGSTSDATTSGSMTSDKQEKILPIHSRLARESRSSSSSGSSAFASVSEERIGESKLSAISIRGAVPGYSKPTAASRARQADASKGSMTSPSESSAVPRLMRGPRRPRIYGDGRELQGFDDLPVHREKESARPEIGGLKRHDSKTRLGKGANREVRANLPIEPIPMISRGRLGTGSAVSAKMLPAVRSPSSDASAPRSRQRISNRKQPTLIRNLGGPNAAPRVEGSNMRWNPVKRRWEGNEEEGRTFENAVRGTGRSAWITKLAVGSSKAVAASSSKSNPMKYPLPVGARVVGDMVFDPLRLCWLNKNKEDEVDPFAGIKEDSDEEVEQTATPKGRQAQVQAGHLKAKSSSASLCQRSDGLTGVESSQWTVSAVNRALRGVRKDVPPSLSNRISSALWTECVTAKLRHDDELAPFLPATKVSESPKRRVNPARDRSSHLYLIQALARKAAPG